MILPRSGINFIPIRWKRAAIKAWPNDWLPFIWNRPKKIPGHLANLKDVPEPSSDDVRPEFRLSKQYTMLNPDDPARKLFSIGHSLNHKAPPSHLGLIHEVDYTNSLEAKIFKLTYALKKVLAKLERRNDPNYTGHTRSVANSIKGRRYRYLCELKELHFDRYEQLRRELNLEDTQNEINMPQFKPHRKIQMRKLAIEYARDLKEKKVEEFMESLEVEKEKFEVEKKSTLEWIAEQERKLGITV